MASKADEELLALRAMGAVIKPIAVAEGEVVEGLLLQAGVPSADGHVFSEECLRDIARQAGNLTFKDGGLFIHGPLHEDGGVSIEPSFITELQLRVARYKFVEVTVERLRTSAEPFESLEEIRAWAKPLGLSVTLDRRRDMVVMRKYIEAPADSEEIMRAGSAVVCEYCGDTYSQHPQSPRFNFLNVLCDGRHVKL